MDSRIIAGEFLCKAVFLVNLEAKKSITDYTTCKGVN